jgi:lysozyme family protein
MKSPNLFTYPIDYVMFWEDEKLEGKVTSDAGGRTRFGLASKYNPQLTDANFYDAPKEDAIAMARFVYMTKYGKFVQADKITNERVRAKVLDMYVNMGEEGAKLVQRACGAHEDGGIGSETLTLLNSASPDRVLSRLATLSLARYNMLEGSADEHTSWNNRGKCLGKIGVNMTFGQGGPKTNEQVLVHEQHGGRSGTGASLEGERASSSGVAEGQAVEK